MASVGVPVIPEQFRDLMEEAITRMLTDMEEAAAWTFHSEKHGIKAYTKVEGDLTAAMGVGHVPYSPRAFWDVVMDVANKKAYDADLAEGTRLKQCDAQTVIDYIQYSAPVFFVAARDFLNVVHWRVLEDGTIVIVGKGIEDLELCPLREPKVVRGQVHIAGWKIVPDADYKGCTVTYIVKSDLKGSIPARVAAKAASDQPYLIHQIAQVLKKSKKLAEIDAQGKLTNTA